MTDLTAVRAARPGLLDDAARTWQQISADLDHEISAWKNGVIAPLETDWSGRAADAALATLNGRARDLITTREYADAMAVIMRDGAEGIASAQACLQMAEDLAARSQLALAPDGSVITTAPGVSLATGLVGARQVSRAEELIGALPPAAAEVSALAQRALALAGETDSQITARLQAIGLFEGTSTGNPAAGAAMLASAGALGVTLARAAIPPRGTSPADVSNWWKHLPAAEQQQLISQDPSQIGWLDGLPATARSQANFLAMDRQKPQLEAQLQGLLRSEPPKFTPAAGPPPAHVQWKETTLQWDTWNSELASVRERLAEINGLEAGMKNAVARTGQHVYLLGFDTTGEGHTIVAVGNPDTATTTVTYVPGLGSHLSGSGGDIGRAATLWNTASATAGPGQKISSVYWLDYNAPQWHGIDQVAGTGDALAGATKLTTFQAGLRAAHHAGGPDRTTVIGHSYGSLLVGEALARHHLKPTDVIFVGSPGVGVDHASQLGMPPSHVWAGANPDDPVARTQWFGTSPADGPFGARGFDASQDPHLAYSPLDPFAPHSAYWDEGSSSLKNMSYIVTGEYGAVTRAH